MGARPMGQRGYEHGPTATAPTKTILAFSLLASIALSGAPLQAQGGEPTRTEDAAPLGERLRGVREGTVRLAFAARDGVCGNGSTWFRTGEGQYAGRHEGRGARSAEIDVTCDPGPVRVVAERRGGRTVELRTYVGGAWRPDAAAIDLGTVRAADAVSLLVDEIERGEAKVARDALLPLGIAAAEVPWLRVLDKARDTGRPRAVRTQALFWAAQAASDRAARDIGVIAATDPDVEVRRQAVFALSRRDDGVEHLLRLARTSTHREVRRAAYFWLGQSADPRATELFAEVLTRP